MTKNQIIEDAKKSNTIELLLFKKNKKTKETQIVNHDYRSLKDLEDYAEQLMSENPEFFYEIKLA